MITYDNAIMRQSISNSMTALDNLDGIDAMEAMISMRVAYTLTAGLRTIDSG